MYSIYDICFPSDLFTLCTYVPWKRDFVNVLENAYDLRHSIRIHVERMRIFLRIRDDNTKTAFGFSTRRYFKTSECFVASKCLITRTKWSIRAFLAVRIVRLIYFRICISLGFDRVVKNWERTARAVLIMLIENFCINMLEV